jgi:hypothetical protein
MSSFHFQFEFAVSLRRDLQRQNALARDAMSERMEISVRTREVIAQSHELMAHIDKQLARRP